MSVVEMINRLEPAARAQFAIYLLSHMTAGAIDQERGPEAAVLTLSLARFLDLQGALDAGVEGEKR